jgi:hypothetical protein
LLSYLPYIIREAIVERHLARRRAPASAASVSSGSFPATPGSHPDIVARIRAAALAGDDAALDRSIKRLGRQVVGAVGWEIDRLEHEIRELVPGIRHVDLETDRGRWFTPDLSSTSLRSAGENRGTTEATAAATVTEEEAELLDYDNKEVFPDVSKSEYWAPLQDDEPLSSFASAEGSGDGIGGNTPGENGHHSPSAEGRP